MPKNEVTDPITDRHVVKEPRLFNVSRDQILTRLWEIGNMNPENTRGSLTGQVKALSMIVAIEGLIPDRRAASNQPAPPPVTADIYQAEWLRAQQTGENNGESVDAASQEAEPTPAPASVVNHHPAAPAPSWAPRVPMADRVAPDTRVPFSLKKNPFARRR
jgi:hypothetical protein